MKPLTLIQLVSEQTMQNLLPVLRLRPATLVHLATPRTVARSSLIVEAARQAACSVRLETITLSGMPSIGETRSAVIEAIEHASQRGEDAVLNFTGGTKLMSIGAFVAALDHKIPSLYVDTQDSVFLDGQTGNGLPALLEGDYSFTPIRRALTVNAVAKANGCPRVTGGRDWRPFLPLAEHLLGCQKDEEATHEAIHGPAGLCPNGREPRDAKGWLALLERDFALPDTVLRLGLAAGLLEPGNRPGSARLPQATRPDLETLAGNRTGDFTPKYFAAIEPIQRALSFFSGSWWEVIIAHRMDRSGRFRDLRWSVHAGERGGSDLEEDVVALDGVQIAYVSCKRGGAKARLLPLLDEINARAHSLGGTFTRRFLAVRYPPSNQAGRNIRTRAKTLGIRVISGEDLNLPDPFA